MVHIIADTTCVLPLELCKQLDITIMPQIIIVGEKTYRDDTDLDSLTFLKILKSNPDLPKTAAPPPSLYLPVFEEYSSNNISMVVICPSSEISGTYRSAQVAAREFPNADIQIIDTRSVAGGLANLVLIAQNLAKSGKDSNYIINTLHQKRKQERMYFMVDTLEYLAKGGRIGNAKALVGGLLQFKPILTLKNGINSPFENQRTKLKAINRLVQLASEIYPANNTSRLNIVHSDDKETALKISDKLRNKLSIDDIPIYDQCASILTHVGPGAIAISYFDENYNNELT